MCIDAAPLANPADDDPALSDDITPRTGTELAPTCCLMVVPYRSTGTHRNRKLEGRPDITIGSSAGVTDQLA